MAPAKTWKWGPRWWDPRWHLWLFLGQLGADLFYIIDFISYKHHISDILKDFLHAASFWGLSLNCYFTQNCWLQWLPISNIFCISCLSTSLTSLLIGYGLYLIARSCSEPRSCPTQSFLPLWFMNTATKSCRTSYSHICCCAAKVSLIGNTASPPFFTTSAIRSLIES